ncbi:hypothetical protein [Rhizobium miluonense]|uniref:Uncharacterized protein n=1 Tax=Rhizobium miluonense TaxID=411945 RepID=A0A1C3U6I5_9HYPH|nr:hypothetical protein [Rhizobium miluonense]SCB10947.1 hypothetical protein GA0061102_100236 [Rhizobium miluonense]
MLFRGGIGAKKGWRALPETEASIDAVVALTAGNPDKALVLSYVGQLVADGFAVWDILENGEIEVRFNSGEMFVLAETTILRLV